MTSSDLPKQGDPGEREWAIYVCEDCDQLAHGPGSRCSKDRRRTWTKMARVPVVPLERAHRAEEEVKRLREAALAVVLTWDNEGSQHGIMSALREAVGYPPERPTREEAKARLNTYLGLPNDPGENG